jgi:histidinol dehydrogenase
VSAFKIRFRGAVSALGSEGRHALLDRSTADDDVLRDTVAAIIDAVRRDGDTTLKSLAREFDKAKLDRVDVPNDKWTDALDALDPALRRAMERAARNIRKAHEAMRPTAVEVETEPGVVVGRRPDPMGRVGVYAPGGRASYPSSVLMGGIPARVAGVPEIIVCSPPDSSGLPPAAVLAACALVPVDRLFAVGGAGAVAAMAWGTLTVPRVDRIVGPGNKWVTEAKLQVAHVVGTDSPAGPSELVVIADRSTDVALVAREMIAQAEHDPATCVVAVAVGDDVAGKIEQSLEAQVPGSKRAEIVRRALAASGAVVSVETLDDAITFSNAYAPEHLLVAVADADALLPRIRNAGAVFVGASSSVAFGDYMTGANHVLPTSGLARSWSGLSTLDFVRWTSWQRVTPEAARTLAADVGTFADAEKLDGHAKAARAWLPSEGGR